MVSHARRRFLAAVATAGAAPVLFAGGRSERRFVGCRTDPTGRHLASVFDERGEILHDLPLPGRGHGFAVHPATGWIAVFARRPGDWTLVFDVHTGLVQAHVAAGDGRHFYGHGAFSPDGRFLYTSENRFDDGTGIIGVWDAGGGWQRVCEWPSRGVGPHEIRVFGRGRLLAVANGGVRTHPDTGRAKLNLDSMTSCFAVLDGRDGALLRSASLGELHRRLSIRHLDVDRDSRIVVAMQHQGGRRDRIPLIAFEQVGRLLPAHVPDDVRGRLRQYAGSVAFDASGRYVAASHPHDGVVSLWTARPASFLAIAELPDACGLAPGSRAGSFVATGAHGQFMRIDARTGESATISRTDGVHWDNHLLAL